MSRSYDYLELSKELEISAPLLMLDFLAVDISGKRAEGVKLFGVNEDFFRGHFPNKPIVPGVLQVAAMVQACKMLYVGMFGRHDNVALLQLKRVKFRKPVMPGQMVKVVVEESGSSDAGVEYKASCVLENGDVASSGTVTLGARDAMWFRRGALSESQPIQCQNGFQEIMAVLPHRPPFLLVEGAQIVEGQDACIGYKNVTGNEPFVNAVATKTYPGFLQVESCAQLSCWMVLQPPENAGKLGIFMSIDSAEFHSPVFAGERMEMSAKVHFMGKYGVAACECRVGGRKVSESEMKFAILDGETIK